MSSPFKSIIDAIIDVFSKSKDFKNTNTLEEFKTLLLTYQKSTGNNIKPEIVKMLQAIVDSNECIETLNTIISRISYFLKKGKIITIPRLLLAVKGVDSCCICTDEIAQEGNKVSHLNCCNNLAHTDCLKSWETIKKICPLCKASIGNNSVSGLGTVSPSFYKLCRYLQFISLILRDNPSPK